MNSNLIQIREHQKNSWNSFSEGWRKWDDFTMEFLDEQGQYMISELNLKPTDKVLDIASGTGEPGLTIAASVNQGGLVIATDLSENMLKMAEIKAQTTSLNNFKVQVADACNLPFEDNTFDAISCRLGFMFFPDMQLAAEEMLRVLKPGGKLVTTVWAEPVKNNWITSILGVLKNHSLELPIPDPKGPSLFRCATPGILKGIFEKLGATKFKETEINGTMNCKTAEDYWEFMNDVVPPVVAALRTADNNILLKVKQDVFKSYEQSMINCEPFNYSARLFAINKSV
ncbi:class I SAM-dependent methyltransferase [Flavobacteriaceae bacterium GSB9]|nr:class I SAM-dependent methyltransferase [Flavobacteriaceae bacterium GSB9]